MLVDLGHGMTLIDLAGLELDLSDALGIKVDLAMKDALKPRIESASSPRRCAMTRDPVLYLGIC